MSEDWIGRDNGQILADAIGNDINLARQILNTDYVRVLATHGSNGQVIYRLVEGVGDNATIGNIWTP